MRLSTLLLLAGIVDASLSWAEGDPYLWLEGVDDEKALAYTHLWTQLK